MASYSPPTAGRCEVFFTGKCRTQSWMRDHYAYGEASVLFPGQHAELFFDVPTSGLISSRKCRTIAWSCVGKGTHPPAPEQGRDQRQKQVLLAGANSEDR